MAKHEKFLLFPKNDYTLALDGAIICVPAVAKIGAMGRVNHVVTRILTSPSNIQRPWIKQSSTESSKSGDFEATSSSAPTSTKQNSILKSSLLWRTFKHQNHNQPLCPMMCQLYSHPNFPSPSTSASGKRSATSRPEGGIRFLRCETAEDRSTSFRGLVLEKPWKERIFCCSASYRSSKEQKPTCHA